MLHEFIAAHREEIIHRCRVKVGARSLPPPTAAEIDHGVPLFLDQVVQALRLGRAASPEIGASARLHRDDLHRQGVTVSQVVYDYGDVCQSVTELAMERAAPISADDFRALNASLDLAIAGAVTQYARERDQAALDGETGRWNERVGFFAHELRNLINTALVAFEVLQSGNVGVGGSTGTVLHRTLLATRDLIGRSLDEVRLTHGGPHRERVAVAGFIDEITPAAILAAHTRGIAFEVGPVEEGVLIEADRQVLAAVLMNLLQNAFKFTRPHTTVQLRVAASADRVVIAVQDACGGLHGGPAGETGDFDELFRPFEQRDANRSGMGLGLAFSRRAVEAHHGRISVRNLAAVGCVFTVDLPRLAVPALAMA